MTTTPARISANRRNAKLSTGPRNTSLVKWNAMKHGLLSKAAILPREDPKEFEAILEALVMQYKPFGVIEHMLVERIAVSYWRLRRAQKAEAGECIRNVAQVRGNAQLKRFVEFYTEAWKEHGQEEGFSDYLYGMQSVEGIKSLLHHVERLENEIKTQGELSERGENLVKSFFKNMGVQQVLMGDTTKREKLKRLSLEREHLQSWLDSHKQRDKEEDEGAMKAANVPLGDTGRRILRYETSIERSLYRAIRELQKLQSIRFEGLQGG